MSFFTATSSFLSLKPKIRVDGDRLFTRTCVLVQLLSLLGYYRSLEVDQRTHTIEIYTRRFWLFSDTRTIQFSEVSHLDYDFSSLMTSWSILGDTHDQLESFHVALVLHQKGEKVELFSFMGEGSQETGLIGVMLGDSVLDFQGSQQKESLKFATLLADFIGVSIGDKIKPLRDEAGREYFCISCKRSNAPTRKKCLYCGGEVSAAGLELAPPTEAAPRLHCAKCNRPAATHKQQCAYCGGPLVQ